MFSNSGLHVVVSNHGTVMFTGTLGQCRSILAQLANHLSSPSYSIAVNVLAGPANPSPAFFARWGHKGQVIAVPLTSGAPARWVVCPIG